MSESSRRDPRGLVRTEIPELPLIARGKVRDVYDLGDEILIVSTDRISAFDFVLPTPIPDKGKVLTQMSEFWFERTQRRALNHLVTTDVESFPEVLDPYREVLAGRSTIARKLDMLPVECVARGFLAGSGLKEYRRHGTVCGIALPPGLEEGSELPEPIFTPATKATDGHDENVPFEEVARRVGPDCAAELRDRTLELYRFCADYARERGILIADTKFEFGMDGEMLLLADELLTPDSSRFWPADGYAPGRPQPAFDKQYVRDWLESSGWNKEPPVPELPDDVVRGTRERYFEAYRLLTGMEVDLST